MDIQMDSCEYSTDFAIRAWGGPHQYTSGCKDQDALQQKVPITAGTTVYVGLGGIEWLGYVNVKMSGN